MKLTFPIIAVSLAFLGSCAKDYSASPGPYNNINAATDSITQPEAVATINAVTGGSFRTSSGTQYIFPAYAFKTGSGVLVSGTVEIKTTEYLQKGDMLFSQVYPLSDEDQLISGGEYVMHATQGGVELAMDTTYSARMPCKNCPGGMRVYRGIEHTAAPGKINWQVITDTLSSVTSTADTTTVTTNNTGYTNADRGGTPVYYPSSPVPVNPDCQPYTISLFSEAGIGDDKNIKAYVSYDGYKALKPLTNIKFGRIYDNKVPYVPVHFIVLAVIKGYLYSGFLGVTPNGVDYRLTLSKTNILAFRKAVNELP